MLSFWTHGYLINQWEKPRQYHLKKWVFSSEASPLTGGNKFEISLETMHSPAPLEPLARIRHLYFRWSLGFQTADTSSYQRLLTFRSPHTLGGSCRMTAEMGVLWRMKGRQLLPFISDSYSSVHPQLACVNWDVVDLPFIFTRRVFSLTGAVLASARAILVVLIILWGHNELVDSGL